MDAATVLLRDRFAGPELDRIRVVVEGDRLEPGAVYLDLHDPARPEAMTRDGMVVGPGGLLVLKSETDPDLWAELARPTGPGQTGG